MGNDCGIGSEPGQDRQDHARITSAESARGGTAVFGGLPASEAARLGFGFCFEGSSSTEERAEESRFAAARAVLPTNRAIDPLRPPAFILPSSPNFFTHLEFFAFLNGDLTGQNRAPASGLWASWGFEDGGEASEGSGHGTAGGRRRRANLPRPLCICICICPQSVHSVSTSVFVELC